MQYLKKYFTEGLIQMAIILSLCGRMVDVGLEPYLPASWHERTLGPTSALTQTQFHNLRNRLEDGHRLYPKNVDLDSFFTARRLLGLVHSLDGRQFPQMELETWLVQREQDPLPVGLPVPASRLAREPPGIERVQLAPSLESRPLVPLPVVTLHEDNDEEEDKEEETWNEVHYHSGALDEEEEEEDIVHQHYCNTEGEEGPGSSGCVNNRELTQNEQVSSSLQECLRLLEETFPFAVQQQFHDAGGGRGELELQSSDSEPLGSSILPSTNTVLDLELHWQDLLAIMEPQKNTNSETNAFEDIQNSRLTETFEAPRQNHGIDAIEADLVMETRSHQGSLRSPDQSQLQPALVPLTPTEELDDHSSAFSSGDSGVYHLQSPCDHMDLFAQDPLQDLCLGLSSEDDINLLTQDLVDTLESSSNPENVLHSGDCTTIQDSNALPQDLFVSQSGDFLFDDDGLPTSLNDLIGDAAILDEIRSLDMALEEGFSPEMAARLDEAGYLLHEAAQQETNRDNSQSSLSEDQVQPREYQQDIENEADSDSGLSLAFSHSQASPCASESSSYWSSSSMSSSESADESPLSDDEDALELCDGPHMEVTIKQEEEELGAVGGCYPNHAKQTFHQSYQDKRLFKGLPWQGHIGHDHTYNQPRSPCSSASFPVGKMSTKQTKSSVRRHGAKPYHYSSHASDSKIWSHDKRCAQALKVPFSNELIINLPVEEFNDLLASFQLNEKQLALIKDIRRRGKNKVAAQNCRKRKMDVLLGLNDEVLSLMRSRSRLLREQQEALRSLQERKQRLKMLYQEVFSRLRDEEGRPLNPMQQQLHFELDGSISVAPSRRGGTTPLTKGNRKQRGKK